MYSEPNIPEGNPLQKSLVDTLTIDRIATMCCVLLVYVMGQFQLTDIIRMKRVAEGVFIVPMFVYVLLRLKDFTITRHANPLLGVVILLFVVGMIFFANPLTASDNLFAMFAIYVLASTSRRNIMGGAKAIVGLATVFSVMALVQFVFVLLYPSLAQYSRVAIENGKFLSMVPGVPGSAGEISFNPMMLFGLYTGEIFRVAGLEISRMRSFASEPSLLVVYFMFPAAIGFLLPGKNWKYSSIIIVFFCVLSLSGSVQISLAFSLVYFVLSVFLSLRILFFYGPIVIVSILMFILITQGVESIMALDTAFGNSDSYSFLSHGNSTVIRAEGLIIAFKQAISNPLGSPTHKMLPYSILISTALSASWLGVFLLLIFFYRLINNLNKLNKQTGNDFFVKSGIALFFGITCTIFLFNDYAMLAYSGLVVLFLFYRVVQELLLVNKH